MSLPQVKSPAGIRYWWEQSLHEVSVGEKKKEYRESSKNPRKKKTPQMPGVGGGGCIYTRLPSLAADCVNTWKSHVIHVAATRNAQYLQSNALWLHSLQRGTAYISLDKIYPRSRFNIQKTHLATYNKWQICACFLCLSGKWAHIYHPMENVGNTVVVRLASSGSREATSCRLHLNICKHIPHATWEDESCMAILLTEGSTVLKQMQRWNNSLES